MYRKTGIGQVKVTLMEHTHSRTTLGKLLVLLCTAQWGGVTQLQSEVSVSKRSQAANIQGEEAASVAFYAHCQHSHSSQGKAKFTQSIHTLHSCAYLNSPCSFKISSPHPPTHAYTHTHSNTRMHILMRTHRMRIKVPVSFSRNQSISC